MYYICESNSEELLINLFYSYSKILRTNIIIIAVLVHRTKIHCNSLNQTCQPSRFWRDSPAFLPDVPRPAKSWKCPAFCMKSDFFCARANTAAESPCYSVFWNAIDFCRLYTSKQISMWVLLTVPLFAGKSRFFTRNVPLKTFSRLAGLLNKQLCSKQ